MIETSGIERLECPPEYTHLLIQLGGTNLYHEPNFIIFWGQTHQPRGICPHRLLGKNRPCWNLAKWEAPQVWGTPEDWDYHNMGPYPHEGAYDLIQPFYKPGEPGKGIIAMPLSYPMVEGMVNLIERHKGDSPAKRKEVFDAEKEAHEKEQERQIEARLHDARPAFLGAVSCASQPNKKTILQLKIEELERWCAKIPPSEMMRTRGPFLIPRKGETWLTPI